MNYLVCLLCYIILLKREINALSFGKSFNVSLSIKIIDISAKSYFTGAYSPILYHFTGFFFSVNMNALCEHY